MGSEDLEQQGSGSIRGSGQPPLRVVCFGDSVMWGQGLLEEQKYGYLVWDGLARACADTGRPTRAGEFAMRAHAGAVIGMRDPGREPRGPPRVDILARAFGVRAVPGWLRAGPGGEIADGAPTIVEQVEGFDDDPQQVDLVLVNGGGNDVGALWYMSPTTSLAALRERIERHCFTDLSQLLLLVARRFPHACIVVPGYMQSFGPETQSGLCGTRAGTVLRRVSWLWQWALDRVFERNRYFREETARQFERAVMQVAGVVQDLDRRLSAAATQPCVRVLFADVCEFRPENVANGSAAWVWGIDLPRLAPQDPLREFRRGACTRWGSLSPWYWASLGHPNVRGARQIAQGIVRRLHAWGRENAQPEFAGLQSAIAKLAQMRGWQ